MALFLFIKKGKNKLANVFLGAANLEVAYLQVQFLLTNTYTIDKAPFLINLDITTFYILGGTIFFYVQSLTIPNLKLNKSNLLHLLPTLPGFAFYIYFQTNSQEYKLFYLHSYTTSTLELFVIGLGFVTSIFYIILSLVKLNRFESFNKQFYSNIHKIRINWARKMLWLFLFLCICLGPVVLMFQNRSTTITLGLVAANVIFMYVFINILFKPELVSDPVTEIIPVSILPEKNSVNNSIDNAKLTEIKQSIEYQLITNKQYLQSGLTLKDLAQTINTSPHLLSQAINQGYEKNFFDLINSYRVAEAIEMLNHPGKSQYTFESIALECGFGTRASFINSFKKVTGKTPSEFRKHLKS